MMKITVAHLITPILSLAVGIALMVAGNVGGWGRVWIAAGFFFVTLGVCAMLLNVAWIAQGPIARILRHPILSVLIFLAVLGTLVGTLIIGVIDKLR